jgi:hypothetical protein
LTRRRVAVDRCMARGSPDRRGLLPRFTGRRRDATAQPVLCAAVEPWRRPAPAVSYPRVRAS